MTFWFTKARIQDRAIIWAAWKANIQRQKFAACDPVSCALPSNLTFCQDFSMPLTTAVFTFYKCNSFRKKTVQWYQQGPPGHFQQPLCHVLMLEPVILQREMKQANWINLTFLLTSGSRSWNILRKFTMIMRILQNLLLQRRNGRPTQSLLLHYG